VSFDKKQRSLGFAAWLVQESVPKIPITVLFLGADSYCSNSPPPRRRGWGGSEKVATDDGNTDTTPPFGQPLLPKEGSWISRPSFLFQQFPAHCKGEETYSSKPSNEK